MLQYVVSESPVGFFSLHKKSCHVFWVTITDDDQVLSLPQITPRTAASQRLLRRLVDLNDIPDLEQRARMQAQASLCASQLPRLEATNRGRSQQQQLRQRRRH